MNSTHNNHPSHPPIHPASQPACSFPPRNRTRCRRHASMRCTHSGHKPVLLQQHTLTISRPHASVLCTPPSHHTCPAAARRRRSTPVPAATAPTATATATAPQHQQYILQQPSQPYVGHQPQQQQPQAVVAVSIPGLLTALGLAATVLVAAATTCFFLWIKPVMQVSRRGWAMGVC